MTDQGSAYARFIESELRLEFERREKLDNRSAASVTATGGLITLSLAAIAVFRGQDSTISGFGTFALLLTVLGFVASAALATAAAVNRVYTVAAERTLDEMLSSHWTDSETTARNFTSQLNIRTLSSLRQGNNRKASFFVASLAGQAFAVLGLAAAVVTFVV